LYGPLPNEKITKDDGYICLDCGEIQFYFYNDIFEEFEDLKLTKIRIKWQKPADLDKVNIK